MKLLQGNVRMKWLAITLAPLLAVFLLAACGGDSSDSAPADQASPTPESASIGTAPEGVTVIDVVAAFVEPRYQPDPIVVKLGKPVQFRITSVDTRHTFTITELDVDVQVTQRLIGDTAVSEVITPQQTGTLLIWCRIHTNAPTMEGFIEVVE